jgi:hypothetical protein
MRDDTPIFLAKLMELRGDRTNAAFARDLGITRQALYLIVRRERSIGRSVQQRILRVYPMLARWLVADAWEDGE